MLEGVTDITERKQAEDALLKQTRLLESITKNMFDMVTLCNLEGDIIFASESHESILGYKLSELTGENVMAFVHPDDLKTIAEELKILIEKGDLKTVQYRYKHKGGHYLWFETVGELLSDENSSSDQIIFSTRDITERKVSEQAIERERKLFKTIVDQIPVMLTRYDPDAKILFLNREFERLIGWKTGRSSKYRPDGESIPRPGVPAKST